LNATVFITDFFIFFAAKIKMQDSMHLQKREINRTIARQHLPRAACPS